METKKIVKSSMETKKIILGLKICLRSRLLFFFLDFEWPIEIHELLNAEAILKRK